jgi:acylphosphatase
MKRRVNVLISGIVQGVNFRRYTQMTAQQLGVHGWVRNLPDGRVEGCFEGEAEAVASLLDWCRSGPPSGRVDHLEIREEHYAAEFSGFSIRY